MLDDAQDGELPGLQGYRQHIPRPRQATEGPPAPWATMAPEQRRPISVARVLRDLTPKLAPPEVEPADRPHAAVLVPIYESEGEAVIVLIRRGVMLASNPGDLAFPGGRLERGERAVDAAVREAEEEVGLRRSDMTLLGRLGGVSRPRWRGSVVPYVAILDRQPVLRPDPVEVDGVLTISLADLADDDVFWQEDWQLPGADHRLISFFSRPEVLGNDIIWGMTAGILRGMLTELLLGPDF